jgi:hypothetical protein
MDPEQGKNIYKIMNKFTKELELSELVGMYLGAACAVCIEVVR